MMTIQRTLGTTVGSFAAFCVTNAALAIVIQATFFDLDGNSVNETVASSNPLIVGALQ